MAKGTPDEITAKWLSRLQGATQEMTAGVGRVTQAPGALAAAKKAKWFNNLQASQDKWARNVAAVPLEAWRSAMTSYGIARVAQGAQAKQHKMQAFLTSFLPYLDRGVQTVKQMDDSTFEARLQRATAMARWNHNYQRPGTSGP